MKGKILDSDYIPGYESYVEKQTKYGTFFSVVRLDEDDEDIDNSFDGCRIAEFDCNLKAYKEKAKWMRQRAIGARTLCNNLFNVLDEENWSKVNHQVDVAFHDADKAKEYYERMRDYRPIYIENLLRQRREIRHKNIKSAE